MAISVVSTAETAVTTAGTSHAITLPASIAAGDLVLITMDIGSTSATFNALTGWTEILDESAANGLKIWWYTGAGVPSAPTFISSGSTRSATIAWRITGADKTITPEIGTTATGTSLTPDPPASATISTTKEYLFIAFAGMAGEEIDDDTWGNTPPTNYLPNPPLQKACGTVGTNLGGLIVAASRVLSTGSAENPGTFNVDVSAAWRAQTVTVHPATWSDTVDGDVLLTGTVSESQTHSQSVTGQILLTGTRTESWGTVFTDTPTGSLTLTTLTPYAKEVLTDSPSLYWRLGTNGLNDQSGNGHGGTAQGGVTIGGASGALYGDSDAATDLDGSSQYVSSSYSPYANSTARTFEGWAYRSTSASVDMLFAGSGGAGGPPRMWIDPSATSVNFEAESNVGTRATWAAAWPGDGQWVHWVLVFDEGADTVELYINGASKGVVAMPTSYHASPGTFQIAVENTSDHFFDGAFDEVAVYEYGLSADRILTHYRARLAGSESSSASASPTGTILLSGSRSESLSRSSTPTGTILLLGSVTESWAKSYTDTATGQITLVGTRTESKVATETATGQILLTGSVSESRSVSETATGTILLAGSVSESWEISGTTYNDTPTGTVLLSGTRSESFSASETVTGTILLAGSAAATQVYTDTPTGAVLLAGSSSESHSVTDTASGTVLLTGSVSESWAKVYTDTPSGTILLSGTRTESASHSPTPSGTVLLAGSLAEDFVGPTTYEDAPTGTILLSGTRVESYAATYTDAPTGTVLLSGTRIESASHSATRSGQVTLSGTVSESWSFGYVDTATGQVTLSGSVAESWQKVYTDASSGQVTLSGSASDSTDHTATVTGTILLSGTRVEQYIPSGASFDSPTGAITLAGSVAENHSRWDNLGGDRWAYDSDNRWGQTTSDRWDVDLVP